LLDALCFFCDYVENTDIKRDNKMINELAKKFLEICQSETAENSEFVQQTIAYGFGVFALNLPKSQFGVFPQAVAVCKHILSGEDAFDEDRIVCTESTLGAIAKIAYNHLDGKSISNGDFVGVLSRMPFTAFENENVSSHNLLIDQYLTPSSIVHNKQLLPAV